MLKIAMVACVAALTAGCALTDETIDLKYTSTVAPVTVAGADAHQVQVSTTDKRPVRDRVSVKKNGYGMELGAIHSSVDPATLCRDAIQQELTRKGFKLGSGSASIDVQLNRFFNDYKVGIITGDAIADFSALVKITDASGRILFAKDYNATGADNDLVLGTPDHARHALDNALAAGVAAIVNDPEFINALLKSGTAPTS